MNKCLYCYESLARDEKDFHSHCAKSFFGEKQAPVLEYSFHEMAALAKNIVERSITVPGVQPKLSLSLVSDILKNERVSRFTVVGAMGGNFIFKPPAEIYPELPQNEHVTMRMAEAFDIRVVPSSLIRLKSGELCYITKRIDRTYRGEKIHMLDMCQITGAFDKYKSSMEKVGKTLDEYSGNTLLDKLYFFELGLFCFLTGNNDMHLKNFSMINAGKEWKLAPAYDLLNVAIVNPDDQEEMALTLQGKRKKLRRSDFEHLGENLGLNEKQMKGVFKRFEERKSIAVGWINKSFLSKEYKEKYRKILEQRYIVLMG